MAMTRQVCCRLDTNIMNLLLTTFLLETSVPYTAFKKAGFEVHFATEKGKTPECDKKMLRGVTQKLLVCDLPIGLLHHVSQG